MTAYAQPSRDALLTQLPDDDLRALFAGVQSVLLDRHATDALMVDVLTEQEARLLRGFRTLSPLHREELCERVNAKGYALDLLAAR